MRAGSWAVVILLASLLALPAVGGQTFLTPGTAEMQIEHGGDASTTFTVKNPINRSLVGFARVDGPLSPAAEVQPTEFRIGPDTSRQVTVTVQAGNISAGQHEGRFVVTLVDQETGTTHSHSANLTATLPAPLLLFGQWENPLPAPLDGVIGLFLLEATLWVLAGAALIGANKLVLRRLLEHIPRPFRGLIIERVDAPLFTVVLAGGLNYSWRFFPQTGVTGLVGGLLSAVLLVAAAFLIYRAIDSVLLYYGRQIAPRTETRWDDVAVPVIRKITIALLAGFVLIYGLQRIGLNLGFLIAGGVVIGLVLSTSLGPTLANLFSGLFILMDRPFREGDDIRLDSGEVCRVERIGMRSTRLYFYRNHELIIAPNQQLENSRIVNLAYPDRRYRMHLPVSVAYGSPIDDVRYRLIRAAREHEEVLDDEESEPRVFFDDFGNDGLMFRLSFYVLEVSERFRIASELRDAIDAEFREAQITIPFPQRTLWYGRPDELLEAGREQAGRAPPEPPHDPLDEPGDHDRPVEDESASEGEDRPPDP